MLAFKKFFNLYEMNDFTFFHDIDFETIWFPPSHFPYYFFSNYCSGIFIQFTVVSLTFQYFKGIILKYLHMQDIKKVIEKNKQIMCVVKKTIYRITKY